MSDCQYYKSRKATWNYHGGEDAHQWCSHPESIGLDCDTDECPRTIEDRENDEGEL